MADAAVMLFAGAKVVDAADAVVKYCCILKLLLLKTHNKRIIIRRNTLSDNSIMRWHIQKILIQ